MKNVKSFQQHIYHTRRPRVSKKGNVLRIFAKKMIEPSFRARDAPDLPSGSISLQVICPAG